MYSIDEHPSNHLVSYALVLSRNRKNIYEPAQAWLATFGRDKCELASPMRRHLQAGNRSVTKLACSDTSKSLFGSFTAGVGTIGLPNVGYLVRRGLLAILGGVKSKISNAEGAMNTTGVKTAICPPRKCQFLIQSRASFLTKKRGMRGQRATQLSTS